MPFQGGFFDTIARVATYFSPFGVYESNHLLTALFGFLCVIAVYKLGSFLASPLTGFLSALFLILTPRFYGDAFNNATDIPFATLSTFAVYYLIRAIQYLPRIPKSLYLKIGISIGLALAVRVGGVFLVGYVGIAFGLWLFGRYFLGSDIRQNRITFRSNFWKCSTTLVGVCLIAYFVMLIWWPAAQVRPIIQPLKGLWHATHYKYPMDVYFEGMTFSSKDLPWYYVLKWFFITMPEFYFFALAAGMILSMKSILTQRVKFNSLDKDRALGIFIILFAILFPIGYTTLTQPVNYDGIRHFLFVVPLLAVIAACSAMGVLSKAGRSILSVVLLIPIFSSAMVTAIDMIQLHPYEYIYFNRMFGKGITEAAKSFETEYWGSSYKEGVEWIVNNYRNYDGDKKVKVASCLYSLSTSYFLPSDRFEYLGSHHNGKKIPKDAKPDLFLATTRWGGHTYHKGKVLHIVSRKNVPLLYIIEVSHDDVHGDADDM